MKNPLYKRLPRELKDEAGKYFVIFFMIVMVISFVSGFLVADRSMKITYDDSFQTYKIEDGHFDLTESMTHLQKRKIEKHNISIFENYFIEKKLKNGSTLRIFQTRTDVNKVCLLKGKFPKQKNEIAIDRMYAENNKINIGDVLQSKNKSWKVTGFVALSDYSSLFSSNSDTMFDAVKFGVAIVSKSEFQTFSTSEQTYRYAWTYDQKPNSEEKENKIANKLMKSIGNIVTLDSFVPQYENQAIHFTGDDMGSDKAMITVLLYIIIVILSFVFGITISNTITKEANTIGTLLASGYTKNELLWHYLMLPLFITFIGSMLGNILGYTFMVNIVKDMYYSSYSLTSYHTTFSMEAFLLTTIIPFVVMLCINVCILRYKLKLSPLNFLRGNFSRKKQKRGIHLSHKIPFFQRFRIRIILQNKSNYIMLCLGIMFANLLLLFGMGLPVVLNHYQDNIKTNMLSPYQYILSVPTNMQNSDSAFDQMIAMFEYSLGTKTENETAEEFSSYALNTTDDICDSEEILIYGIKNHSKYVNINTKKKGVYISSSYADKYQLKKGDSITLKEKYKSKAYQFKVQGIYHYIGSLSIFMSQKDMNQTFDLDSDYFSGYFSKTKITDINQEYIGTVLDLDALTKVSRQLDVSMGSMMYLVDGFAIMIFVVLIYLLSKLVIEKNVNVISMTKILGYETKEIGLLYVIATSLVVFISLILTIVIDSYLMIWIFRQMMLTSMSGWIPFDVDFSLFLKMFFTGMITYVMVAILEFQKIRKIPMEEALKTVE